MTRLNAPVGHVAYARAHIEWAAPIFGVLIGTTRQEIRELQGETFGAASGEGFEGASAATIRKLLNLVSRVNLKLECG